MTKTKDQPIKDNNQELLDLLKNCESERDQAKINWQRTQADFDNYRKRAERDRNELWQNATIDTLLKLAPIIDTFRRALDQNPKDESAWCSGIKQIYKQLNDLLLAEKLERIEVIGKNFDPVLHEAISQINDPKILAGQIIQEIESGYQYRGIIVKPAKVIVSAGA